MTNWFNWAPRAPRGVSSIHSLRAVALASVIAGSSLATLSAQAADLTVALESEVTVVDPHFSPAYISRSFAYTVYDTLFASDSEGKIHPQMVDTWTRSDDGMEWTFTLRDGLLWHDGAPVLAEDCVASLKRWAGNSPIGGRLIEAIETLEPVDEKTFRLVLAKPFGLVLETLGTPGSPGPFMLPKRLADISVKERIPEVIGSGPYVYDASKHVSGDRIVLTKNTAYVPRSEPADFLSGGKVVNVDSLTIRVMPDPLTSVNALQTGELDYINAVSADLLPILTSDPQVNVAPLGGLNQSIGFYRINSVAPPLNDPAIRRVVALAVDQQEVLSSIGYNDEAFGRPCNAFFGCGTALESNVNAGIFENASIEAAREALAETDYDGEPLVVLIPTNINIMRVANEVLAQRLTEVGFNVDAQAMDWASVLGRRQQKEGWNIVGVSSGNMENISPVTNPIISFNCRDNFLSGFYCIEEIVPLTDAFLAASSDEERGEIAEQIQTIVYDQAMTAYFGQYSQPAAWRTELTGVIPSVIPIFWNLAKQ